MENEKQLRAWIKVVTKNLTLNILRKNKMMRNQMDIESVLMDSLIHGESIEREVETRMFEENIISSLAEIAQDHRMLIEMKWKQHKSNKDIADQLGSTEGAIKQKLHRAREALRKKLRQKWSSQDE
jgi:RNA polymerase sigma-70 factor, ECF subfamily